MSGDETHPTLLERLLPPVEVNGEDGQPKPVRMTQREQWVAAGLGVANVAIAAGAASALKDQQALALLAGLAAAVITLVGAYKGNRIVAIVGLFSATLVRPASTTIFLAVVLPYYGAAMWMFLRYNKLVKAQAVLRRQQRSETRGPRPARSGRARGKGATAAESTKKSARPSASKRYTPPKPVRKPPPPPSKPPRDRSIVD